MIFVITHYHDKGVPEAGITPVSRWSWALHRVHKKEVAEAVCRSVNSWPSERQTRADINQSKRAMGNLRFASVKVLDIDGDDEESNTPAVSNQDRGDA